jgi:hypothetical protein
MADPVTEFEQYRHELLAGHDRMHLDQFRRGLAAASPAATR